ncbi:MAG: terminase large subunit [Gemmatimonadota bacterium]|nr:terminase large subunit [Gemmatimonadota bacterium]
MGANAKAVIEYIEGLTLTQGRFAGQPFKLHPWERRWIRGFTGTDGDCALSVARGNGKSTLIAGIACAALDGPLMEPNSQVVVAASSFDQGRIIFEHVKAFMVDKLADTKRWRLQDSTNRAIVTDRRTGASLRCIGSDPRRMHGLAPRLVVGDELAQWEPNKINKALAALQTSMGKIPDSRALWIGTRPDSADHPFSKFLYGGCEYSQVHAARKSDPPFQKRTWTKANPALRFLPDLEKTIRREVVKAKKDPAMLAAFRSLRLNLGVSESVESVLLAFETWEGIESEALDRAGRYVLGIDLGGSAAMSAAAAYWTGTGALDAFAVFPETPDLIERGRRDGVDRLYVECFNRGELIQAGARVSDVGALLREVLDRWGAPGAIVCDRWREQELRQVLAAVEFPRCQLIVRGQGYRDGGADVREFRRACVDERVRPAKSLLLRAAVGGARVQTDPAGNAKLAKGGEGRRSRCRDDAAAAAILAVAEGVRRANAEAAAPAEFSYAIV